MEISEYKNIYKNEGSHFFYTSLHSLILGLVGRMALPASSKILDAGCGTGLLAKKLQPFGDVTGLDYKSEAVGYAKRRGVKVVRGSVTKLPFPKNSFDLVTSIDVIYHKSIREDTRALGEFNRVLTRGGYLLLRVPATRWLHSKHDVHVHTRERYELSDLKHKLIKADFKIIRLTYVNFSLFPLAIAKQMFESLKEGSPQSGVQKTNGVLNSFLGFLIRIENFFLLRGLNLPVGIGLVAVCQKM